MPNEDDDLLDRTADLVFAEVDPAASMGQLLPREREVFVMIYTAQGIIDNGGFQYLFECDFPGNPEYKRFSDAYREIGAGVIADLLDRAASLFPFTDAHLKRDERISYLRQHCVEADSPMGLLSGEAIGQRLVFTRLAEYVRTHSNAFK